MRFKRSVIWIGVAAVALAVLSGCPFIGVDGFDKSACYLKLSVGTGMAAKTVDVSEIAVTSLTIVINDSAESLVQSVTWNATEGPQVYFLEFEEEGDYELLVTHSGDGVDVTETGTFALAPMKITVINIVPGLVGAVSVEPGEGGPDLLGWLTGTWSGDVEHPNFGTVSLVSYYGVDKTCSSIFYNVDTGEMLDDTSMRGTFEVEGLTIYLNYTEMYYEYDWHVMEVPTEVTWVVDESAGSDVWTFEPWPGASWTVTKQ